MIYSAYSLRRGLGLNLLPILLLLMLAGNLGAAETASVAADQEGPFQWFPFLAPFHSVVLHLPIGFVIMAFVLDLYSLKFPSPELRRGIFFCLFLCVGSAVLAIVLGLMRVAGGGYEEEALSLHKWYGIAVGILTCVALLIHLVAYKKGEEHSAGAKWVYRLVMVANVATLGAAGHLGGNLTYGSEYLVANAPSFVKKLLADDDDKKTDPVMASQTAGDAAVVKELSEGEKLFVDHVQPALKEKCERCHGAEKQKGGYVLHEREGALAGGDSDEPGIVAGKPLESYIVKLITMDEDADDVMPPSGKQALTPEEVGYIIRWITLGAPYASEEG